MRAGGYRDGLAALRNRVAEKKLAVGAPERRLSLLRRAVVAPLLVSEIDDLLEATDAKATTLEELTRIDHALDAVAARQEAMLAELRQLVLPPLLVPPAEEGPTDVAVDLRTTMASFAAAFGGSVEGWGRHGAVSRFVLDGAEMAYAARLGTSLGEVVLLGRVMVPVVFPLALAVRLERFTDSILRALGLRHEIELRIMLFDQLFWIEGAEETARALLDPDVRTGLRGLRDRSPTLSVFHGRADLSWVQPWRGAHAAGEAIATMRSLVSAATVL